MIQLLTNEPVWWLGYTFMISLLVGSFLNVLIYRLPRMMESEFKYECQLITDPQTPPPTRYNLFLPRSSCPHCQTQIQARDNIPLFSWLWLKGRCRHCQAPISARYPLVELSTALLSTGLAWHFGFGVAGLAAIIFGWLLIALFLIDADTYLLPDNLTLGLLWLGLVVNLGGVFVPLHDAVIGSVAGYLSLWLVYWGFKLLTGKEGMGYGDFKLLAALGAWLGWQLLPLLILLSSVVGVILGVAAMLLAGRGWSKPLPFGPYLASAGLICLVWGKSLQGLL